MPTLLEEIRALREENARLDSELSMAIENIVSLAEDIGKASADIELLKAQAS